MNIKILMFSPYYPPVPGGQESHVYEITKRLRKKGIKVSLLTRYIFSRSKLRTFLFYFKSLFRLFSEKSDIIHGHDVHVGTVLTFFKYFSRKPTILTIHSSIFLETYKKYKFFYKNMLDKQNLIITTSKELQNACKKIRKNDVYYIPNGIDIERFKPKKSDYIRKKFRIPNDKKILITVRRLDKKNNVIELAKGFEKVLCKHDCYLIIVGDGEQREKIEKLNNKRIIITGFVPNKDIPKYLNSSDLFVIPSIYEATSISCLEAMACGLPIVATNVGGLPDLIRGNGFLCKPNADSISNAIIKALNNDLKTMGKLSRKIAENFSWDKIIEKYVKIYKEALK